MIVYLKNQSNYKMKDFEGMRYNEIRPIFEKIWDFYHNFVPIDLEIEKEKKKPVKFQEIEIEQIEKNTTGKRKKISFLEKGQEYPIVEWEDFLFVRENLHVLQNHQRRWKLKELLDSEWRCCKTRVTPQITLAIQQALPNQPSAEDLLDKLRSIKRDGGIQGDARDAYVESHVEYLHKTYGKRGTEDSSLNPSHLHLQMPEMQSGKSQLEPIKEKEEKSAEVAATTETKVGVVAFLLAACQKLHSHEQKWCQALSGAVYVETEPPSCIVPRIQFLNNYFYCKDKSNWDWPSGPRMHTMGPLTLRSVFKFKYT
ncbi:pumilio homolog 23 [Tanacetum coccineum]